MNVNSFTARFTRPMSTSSAPRNSSLSPRSSKPNSIVTSIRSSSTSLAQPPPSQLGVSTATRSAASTSAATASSSGTNAKTTGNDFASLLGTVGDAAGSITNAIGVFQNAENQKPVDAAVAGAQAGASVGSLFGGWGAAIGGVVGAAAGFFTSLFGGKDPKKEERKAMRAALAQTSLGKNLEFQGYVSNGQLGVISLHGKHHKVDNSSGVLAMATGLTNVIATALTPNNPRLQSEVSAMFLNAIRGATNFTEATESVRSLMKGIGLSPEKLAQGMVEFYKAGLFSKEQLSEHLTNLDILAGNIDPAQHEAAVNAQLGTSAAPAPQEHGEPIGPDQGDPDAGASAEAGLDVPSQHTVNGQPMTRRTMSSAV